MKKCIAIVLCFFIASSNAAFANESISDHAENTDALYRESTGNGAIDGAFTATSASMIGWGVGLALGIGILAALLHQSKGSSAHN